MKPYLLTVLLLTFLAAPLHAGGSVTIEPDGNTRGDGDEELYVVTDEPITYIATWNRPENTDRLEEGSLTWSVTGDGTIPENSSGDTVKITVTPGSGAKSFTITMTTSWDLSDLSDETQAQYSTATASASQSLIVFQITQFNPKSENFPKCKDEDIGRDDFVIITNPSGHDDKYILEGLGTSEGGTFTATASYEGDSMPAEYEVDEIGDDPIKESMTPDNVNKSFSGALHEDLTPPMVGFSVAGTQYERSGTVTGTGVFNEIGFTTWTSCGGDLDESEETTFQVGVGASVTTSFFDSIEATAGFTMTWNSKSVVTVSSAGEDNREIKFHVYEQIVDLTANWNNDRERTIVVTPLGITSTSKWKPSSGTGSDTGTSGYLSADRQKWIKCCDEQGEG